jgi:NADP-dependent aldehyde dehydrogenase
MPATTSVGLRAIDRWLIPIAYQDWPEELLPEALRRDAQIRRRQIQTAG